MSGWTRVKVEDLAAPTPNALATGPFGSSISSKFFVERGVPVIRGSNLSENVGLRLSDENLVFIEPEKAATFSRSEVRRGDLVFTCWGTIGQVGLVDQRAGFERYIVSNKQMKLTPDPSKADSLFLYFAFSSPMVMAAIQGQTIGSSVPGFNLGQLRNIELDLPPIDEQRRIAAVLGALDDKIELNRKMNRTLEEMAQAIFKSWFIDFDGHDDLVDSEIGPVPRGWEVGPIDEIIEVIGGGTPKRSEPRFWGGSVPWFSVQDAPSLSDVFVLDTKEHITEAGLAGSSARLVPAGTTIISARGTVGKLAVAEQPMAFNQSCYGIAPSRGYTHEFVYFLLRSVVAHLQRSAHGSVFDTITRATFQTAMVVQPPVERTRAFANTAGPLLKRIAANGRESSTLTDLRDTLLPKLISGELRVPEMEKLVEAAS